MMRVLIVEDQGPSARDAAKEIQSVFACEIDIAADPLEAIALLSRRSYDAAVVDMLFTEHTKKFRKKLRQHEVKLTDKTLHLSGLAVLYEIRERRLATNTVLWTGGDANRELHMIFAREELGAQVLCLKDPSSDLLKAVQYALDGKPYIDPFLGMEHSMRFSAPLRETLLVSKPKLAVWRAMALGMRQHRDIAKAIGVKPETVNKGMNAMKDQLLSLDRTYPSDGSPSGIVISFAAENWEFLLDDTVRKMCG